MGSILRPRQPIQGLTSSDLYRVHVEIDEFGRGKSFTPHAAEAQHGLHLAVDPGFSGVERFRSVCPCYLGHADHTQHPRSESGPY